MSHRPIAFPPFTERPPLFAARMRAQSSLPGNALAAILPRACQRARRYVQWDAWVVFDVISLLSGLFLDVSVCTGAVLLSLGSTRASVGNLLRGVERALGLCRESRMEKVGGTLQGFQRQANGVCGQGRTRRTKGDGLTRCGNLIAIALVKEF